MILSYYSECDISAIVDLEISLINRQVSKELSLTFDAFRGIKKFLRIFLIFFYTGFEMVQQGTSLQLSNVFFKEIGKEI